MVEIRQVEAYDAAAMDTLLEPIFGDDARHRHMRGLIGPDADARLKALRASLPKADRIRIAAFDGEQLIGCCTGWYELNRDNFYIGLSAVEPAYRKQGIYTRMLATIEQAVRARGAASISSQHVATNNAVLIAKLRLGYVIAGTEFDEQMGLLVRLVLHLVPQRLALYRVRTGTLLPDGP